jgi:hypothetical protein
MYLDYIVIPYPLSLTTWDLIEGTLSVYLDYIVIPYPLSLNDMGSHRGHTFYVPKLYRYPISCIFKRHGIS